MTSECTTSLPKKDVGRLAKQDKTCAVKGVGPKLSTLKPSTLLSVAACQGKAAVFQGLKALSPSMFAPQRHPNLYQHLRVLCQGYTLTPGIVPSRAYRTYRSSGHGYEGRIYLTEVPGTGIKVLQN